MDIRTTALFIVFICNIVLGLIIYSRNRKSEINQAFGLFAILDALWAFGLGMFSITNDHQTALMWAKFYYIVPVFIASTFYYFSLVFPNNTPISKRTKFFVFVPTLIHTLLLIIPGYLTKEVVGQGWGKEVILGAPEYLVYSIFFPAYFATGLYILWKKHLKSIGLVRQQLLYIFVGVLVPGAAGYIFNLLYPWFGNYRQIWVGPIFSLLITGSIFYSIVKHQLMDIRLVFARSIAYSLLVAIIAIFYTASTFALSNLILRESYKPYQLVISTILTLIVAFTFQPLRKRLEKATDKIFFKNAYDPQTLLAELTHIMATTLLLKELSLQLLDQLLEEMKLSRGAFVLVNIGKIFAIESRGFNELFLPNEKEVFLLQSQNQTLILENLEEGPVKDLLRKYNLSLTIPLKTGKEEIGLLVLGEKENGEIYSEQDLNVLHIFSSEVSVAIQNAKSYEEIRRFNITLKEEVEGATKELKVANDKLRELDKLKDEFISVTSHDLRTPLTAIKSYLWLALHGKAGKLNEKMDFYLGRSYQSAERMLALISDLLDVSRIERGKIELHLEPADLLKVLEMVLDELQSKAIEGDIKLSLAMPKTPLPEVMLDQERFPEIITNLVGNALKFTPKKGKVTISTTLNKDKVEVSVTDNGVGIGKTDLPKLFSKFGRLDSSYQAIATTGGTGLGLYITKNLVQLHGGQITVLSQLGKGTTFTFSLKVATEVEKKQKKYIPAPQGVIINPELMGQFKTTNENPS